MRRLTFLLPVVFLCAFDFPVQRIIGGQAEPADSEIARSTVAFRTKQGRIVGCTASIIGPRLLLTAGHCATAMKNPQEFEAVFGLDVASAEAPALPIARITIHPEYNSITSMNILCPFMRCPGPADFLAYLERFDFALVSLAADVPAGWRPVELNADDAALDVKESITSGFGNRGNRRLGEKDVSGLLTTRRSPTVLDARTRKYVSASTPDASSCFGDSGGPMYVRRDGRLLQIGVASHATSLSRDFACIGEGTAYGSVAGVIGWIRETAAEMMKDGPAVTFLRTKPFAQPVTIGGTSPFWLKQRLKEADLQCAAGVEKIAVRVELAPYWSVLMGRGRAEITAKDGSVRRVEATDTITLDIGGNDVDAIEVWSKTLDITRTLEAYLGKDNALRLDLAAGGAVYGTGLRIFRLVAAEGKTIRFKSAEPAADGRTCDLNLTLN